MATLYRWLNAYDPDRPVASLRPKKPGPKTPRWDAEALDAVIKLIRPYPHWVGLGRHRVAMALAGRGIKVSEATVTRLLPIARERIAAERDRKSRAEQVRQNHEMATTARRDARAAAKEAEVRQWIKENLTPDLTPDEAMHRFAQGLADTFWKIRVKDLTPTLRGAADAYRRAACDDPGLPEDCGWLHGSWHWRDQDHARVAALNNLRMRYRSGELSRRSPLLVAGANAEPEAAPSGKPLAQAKQLR